MYATRLGGRGARINFEGRIFIASGEPSSAYTQIYRNGVIEAVRVGVLNSSQSPGVIPSLAYEEAVVSYLPQCFQILRKLGCNPPVLVGISLIGVRGLKLAVDVMVELSMGGTTAIDRDVLLLPEIVVEDLSTPAALFLEADCSTWFGTPADSLRHRTSMPLENGLAGLAEAEDPGTAGVSLTNDCQL